MFRISLRGRFIDGLEDIAGVRAARMALLVMATPRIQSRVADQNGRAFVLE